MPPDKQTFIDHVPTLQHFKIIEGWGRNTELGQLEAWGAAQGPTLRKSSRYSHAVCGHLEIPHDFDPGTPRFHCALDWSSVNAAFPFESTYFSSGDNFEVKY